MRPNRSLPKEYVNQLHEVIENRVECTRCDALAKTLHHRDEDQSNNDPDNLEPMCQKCHMEEPHKGEVHWNEKGSNNNSTNKKPDYGWKNVRVCKCGCGRHFEPIRRHHVFFNAKHRDNYHNELKRMILKEVKGLRPDQLEEVRDEIRRITSGMKRYTGGE